MKKILKNFRLAPNIVSQLESYSKATGEDMTDVVERAIKKFLDSSAMEVADEHEAKARRIRDYVSKKQQGTPKGARN